MVVTLCIAQPKIGGQNFGTTVDTQLHALIDESKLAKYFKLFWYFLFDCFVVLNHFYAN